MSNCKTTAFWLGIAAVIVCITSVISACSKDNAPKNISNNREEQNQNETQSDPTDYASNELPGLEELEPVVDNNWPTSISRATRETTAKNLSFDIQIDKPTVIIISCVTESGQIDMKIKDKNKNIFFDEQNMQTGTFEADLNESGTYAVVIQTDKHTGSFQIAPKK